MRMDDRYWFLLFFVWFTVDIFMSLIEKFGFPSLSPTFLWLGGVCVGVAIGIVVGVIEAQQKFLLYEVSKNL